MSCHVRTLPEPNTSRRLWVQHGGYFAHCASHSIGHSNWECVRQVYFSCFQVHWSSMFRSSLLYIHHLVNLVCRLRGRLVLPQHFNPTSISTCAGKLLKCQPVVVAVLLHVLMRLVLIWIILIVGTIVLIVPWTQMLVPRHLTVNLRTDLHVHGVLLCLVLSSFFADGSTAVSICPGEWTLGHKCIALRSVHRYESGMWWQWKLLCRYWCDGFCSNMQRK